MVEPLAQLFERHGGQPPLDRALLTVAAEAYPQLSEPLWLARLDHLAARAIALGANAAAVERVLFVEDALAGNAEDYYDPRNSFLNDVLERKLGLPITLAAIYLEVARRVGLGAVGVGFPGHFLVKRDDQLIDPFAGGRVLDAAELGRLLRKVTGGPRTLEPWMLAPVDTRAIVTRVLSNLKHAYVLRGDLVAAVRALDRLLSLAPERAEERRDRGLLYAQLGLAGAAVTDLEAYLNAAPQGRDAEAVKKMLPSLRHKRLELN